MRIFKIGRRVPEIKPETRTLETLKMSRKPFILGINDCNKSYRGSRELSKPVRDFVVGPRVPEIGPEQVEKLGSMH